MKVTERHVPSLVGLRRCFVSLMLGSCLAPLPVAGQTTAPVDPLGSAARGLSLNGSLSGGYDVNTYPGAGSLSALQNPLFQPHNTNFGGDVALNFSVPGRRVDFGGSGGSSLRTYRGSDFIPVSHFVSAGASAGLTQHLTVQGTASASYSPRYQFELFPALSQSPLGQMTLLPLDFGVSVDQVLSYTAGGLISYVPTKRSTLALTYNFRDQQTDTFAFRGKTQDATAIYHRGITKGLGFRFGYRYQLSEYGNPSTGATYPVRGDSLDVGLDYGAAHGLTLARRTTITFGFGTAAYAGTVTHRRSLLGRYRLVGNANLTQQLVRTWKASVAYNRGMGFLDGVAGPVFSDAVNAGIGGQLTRRLVLNGNVAYSNGSVDSFSSAQQFHAYRSTVNVRGLLTRHLAAFVEYFNYSHTFADSSFLVQDAPPQLHRQGVRAGLAFNTPLFGRRGTPSGSLP